MNEQIRISAKNLGELAMPDFCPRCFWIKLRLKNKLPFQIFPGIFSSIDSYTKRIVHSWFDNHRNQPVWLNSLGNLVGYRETLHFSKFRILDEENNILLTGNPDDVFIKSDSSHIIVDYKTAKYTAAQDKLHPLYEAQLNSYAMIGSKCGLEPISKLALVYMEPVTDESAAANSENHNEDGFDMGFSAHVLEVKHDPSIITPLLMKTREIYELEKAPSAGRDCNNCQLLVSLIDVANE